MRQSLAAIGFIIATLTLPAILLAAKAGEERIIVLQDGGAVEEAPPHVRFEAIDIFVDSGEAPLAAWQIEFKSLPALDGATVVKIVGIESGEHPAYAEEPPHYDPKAMMNDRAIIAAFSLNPADRLPSGETRITTVHVQITGDAEPEYELKLTAAATPEGGRIPAAKVRTRRGNEPRP